MSNTTGPSALRNPRIDTERRPRPHVLLAEDDDEMRHLLDSELRVAGYAVSTVADGTEMLETLSDLSRRPAAVPDVIVMDVLMPGYSGLHILAALRAAEWKTPVILITAFGDARVHEEAARLGAVLVFDKPFDVDDLRMALLHVTGEDVPPPRSESIG